MPTYTVTERRGRAPNQSDTSSSISRHPAAVTDEGSRARSRAVAAVLRGNGIPCEVAPSAARFGKQIRYADRRGIPFVWFPGAGDDDGDQVKDIRSGEQVDADAGTWRCPEADLRPAIVTR